MNTDERDSQSKVRFLQETLSQWQPEQSLTCIETHMSWIFLIGDSVLKMKKPVQFPFLDFSTLTAREFYCREEVRLNNRLAPGVYLGLMLLQQINGNLMLVPESQKADSGKVLDWLVAMRRLPAQHMLDQLITRMAVTPKDFDALITLLRQFYLAANVAEITPDDYLSRFSHQQKLAREMLLKPEFNLQNAELILNNFDLALLQGENLLRERVIKKRILEGHGDLRPEHVCLLQPPLVIDCLEFNLKMRQIDPFDEIAYLGLECKMLALKSRTGADSAWIATHLVSKLAYALKEQIHPALLQLYMANRAILRARLSIAHLLDATPRSPEKWAPLAQSYLNQAMQCNHHFNLILHPDSR